MTAKKILFTGLPRSGKTTLIESLVKHIKSPATGFFTREIKEKGHRVGFSIHTLDGKQGLLAHQRIKSRYRVGKYGVVIDDIDRVAVPSMLPEKPDTIVVIDEIGKMECFSPLFRKTLVKILDSDHPVLGSIALKGDRFMQEITARQDLTVVHVTLQNRDSLAKSYANLNRLQSKVK
ncbi:MAG: hypothetical protein JSW04_11645 [Desulfobacterales bacterium]|nr:MAG: hypothetical protein JSV38_03425 [Desulfobacterales bacterium]UCD89080.1 MAG: hypothetical protein JSW04_11645 [Desulfobacterales bacterium]